MSNLTIPDSALVAAIKADREADSADGPQVCEEIVRAAAPLVVAAELRRIARDLDPSETGILREVADELVARANELDPAGAR